MKVLILCIWDALKVTWSIRSCVKAIWLHELKARHLARVAKGE